MKNRELHHIRTISQFHELRNLPKPEHPLISVIDLDAVDHSLERIEGGNLMFDFYSIAIKRGMKGKVKYGQQMYDFDEGIMTFMSPGQIFGFETEGYPMKPSGWMLLFHPDFLWNTSLGKNIQNYEFFDYSVHEALFLSEKEEITINNIIRNIQQEYHSNIDKFSQTIIISQLETLLNYSERFYQRQFITRKISSHHTLDQLEKVLTDYFKSDDLITIGLPSVQYVADRLNLSPGYLSNLLKVLTGQSTQQHIHNKLIEKAKERLSTTDLSISEIAYELGFEHSQSFSKLFKAKTKLSPKEFRESFS